MFKKILLPLAVLGMLFFTQCKDVPVLPQEDNPETLKASKKGNDGGGGGVDYGDLIICLRTADGIPYYEPIVAEQGISYYPLPIKIDEVTLEPLATPDDTYPYATFNLNEEGDVVPDIGYIVQEVDFGRLNVVRAPQAVLDAALGESIGSLTQVGITAIKTDASGRLIVIVGNEDWLVNFDADPNNDEFDDKTIDAPRENVAIYQELLSNGLNSSLSFLAQYGFSQNDVLTLAYGAIAGGADKTGTINVDEIAYMNNWLLKWNSPNIVELPNSPDVRDRHYYDYRSFTYNRTTTYGNKYVRITALNPDGTWTQTYRSLLSVVPWTAPAKLVDYENGANINLSGFANAADDAVQVLDFIHSSDLIVYSPYFTASGFVPPTN